MSYDGLFLGRIDYQDKRERLRNRNAEMVWQASDSLGPKADLFTGVLFNTYSPPPGFCFDILCSDDPIIDDKSSPEFNVDQKVDLEKLEQYINIRLISVLMNKLWEILWWIFSSFIHHTFHNLFFKIQLKAFLEYVEKQADTSRTNNIILTMGGDFTYMDADVYYANLDRLIRYFFVWLLTTE